MKRIDSNGYIWIDGIQEHRKVVENFIGRELRKSEVVHHINENKQDNRIENLMVFQSQKEHAAFHRKMDKFRLNRTKPLQREIDNRWNYLKILDSNPKLQEAICSTS